MEEQSTFAVVEQLIRDGKYSDAQQKLDDFDQRDAEWHYLQAMLYYRKNWMNECQKQLEIAKSMEPDNSKYTEAYNKFMTNNGRKKRDNTEEDRRREEAEERRRQQENRGEGYDPYSDNGQMGGDGCNDACTCCQAAICADCLCRGCR